MEAGAIIASLVVAAIVVMTTYLYASRQGGEIVGALGDSARSGVNTASAAIGVGPLFPAVRKLGGAAATVASPLGKAAETGAGTVAQAVSAAERAVADTVTPGGVSGAGNPFAGLAGDFDTVPPAAAVSGSLGYCYVGNTNDGGRVCAQVERKSGCMSGEYFGAREACVLNSGRGA